MLIDSHVHLQLGPLCDDIDGVIQRAAKKGVGELWCCATCEDEFQTVIDIATAHQNVRPFIGVHPCLVSGCLAVWREKFIELLENNPDVNVGEIGLDRWFKGWEETRDLQEDVFKFQLELCAKFGRVAEIHFRRAFGWLMDVLQSTNLPERFILHSYSGPEAMIEPLAEMGAYFTFSGTLLGLNNKKAHAAALAVPQDRLLIETDSPDLPIPGCGRPNYPHNLPVVFNELAKRRGLSPDELEEILYRNSRVFLGLNDE